MPEGKKPNPLKKNLNQKFLHENQQKRKKNILDKILKITILVAIFLGIIYIFIVLPRNKEQERQKTIEDQKEQEEQKSKLEQENYDFCLYQADEYKYKYLKENCGLVVENVEGKLVRRWQCPTKEVDDAWKNEQNKMKEECKKKYPFWDKE